MFKKNNEPNNIEELTTPELTRLEMEFAKTAYGKKINRLTLIPIIITIVTILNLISTGLANGYVDFTNIGIILMIGSGLIVIARIMYYQNVNNYFIKLKQKK